jgi:hypothetical protein
LFKFIKKCRVKKHEFRNEIIHSFTKVFIKSSLKSSWDKNSVKMEKKQRINSRFPIPRIGT